MTYSKSFPKSKPGSTYPEWEEVTLSDDEELLIEDSAKNENIRLMKECMEDAKRIIAEKNLKVYQSDIVNLAIALFEKRASHPVYWKEKKAKEKFDKKRD